MTEIPPVGTLVRHRSGDPGEVGMVTGVVYLIGDRQPWFQVSWPSRPGIPELHIESELIR